MKRVTAAFQPLEKVGAAKAHEALARAGKVIELLRLIRRRRLVGFRRDIVTEAVARQVHQVYRIHDRRGIESRVLIVGVLVIDLEPKRARHAFGEVGTRTIFERQELATVGRVGLGIVVLNERARATNHVEAH